MAVLTVSTDSSSVVRQRKRIDGKGRKGKREKRNRVVDRRTWGQRRSIKNSFKNIYYFKVYFYSMQEEMDSVNELGTTEILFINLHFLSLT